MTDTNGYILGIDGGGTSTICLLADSAGQTLAQVEAPPSNHRKSDLNSVREAIRSGLDELARKVGLNSAGNLRLLSICAGLAGVDIEADVQSLTSILRSLTSADYLQVVNDGEIALAGALDDTPGVLVISGTGSIVWACAADGRRVRVGGWDYVFSDEGSGFDIGTRVLRAVAAAHDHRTPPTLLSDGVYQSLGVKDFEELFYLIYLTEITPQVIASLAPLADSAAEENDAIAKNLLEDAALELTDLTAAAAQQAGLNNVPQFPVVPVGGVLLANGYFSQRFRKLVSEQFHNSIITEAQHSPAEGAVRLALRALSEASPDAGLG